MVSNQCNRVTYLVGNHLAVCPVEYSRNDRDCIDCTVQVLVQILHSTHVESSLPNELHLHTLNHEHTQAFKTMKKPIESQFLTHYTLNTSWQMQPAAPIVVSVFLLISPSTLSLVSILVNLHKVCPCHFTRIHSLKMK